MKLILLIFILFLQSGFSQNIIELVESIPVETSLDNPDIRNTQEVWLEMINSAQKTLDIEQFYISNKKGEALDTVLNAIVAAANRGVKVRIIIDAGMYQTYPETADDLDKYVNIEVRKLDIKSLTGGIQHSKYFIVDSNQVFLGSQNFDWRSLTHIHELGIRIKDPKTITFFKNIFNYDYNLNEDNLINDTLLILSTPYYSRVNDYNYYQYFPTYSSKSLASRYGIVTFVWDELINMIADSILTDIFQINRIIQSAKSEINLQFLSYKPVTKYGYWEEVDTALISASKRGVKVKLLVTDWNLSKTAVEHFKDLIQYPNFEVRYTSIPDYSGGFIPYARVEHCKFITADSTCWIGTSNMSYGYFYESRNVGLVVESEKFTQRIRDIFYKSWESEYAYPIEPNGEYTPRKRN